ncbi:MAG: molecular chaperone HtpG [Acidobacteriota bacterium]
MSTEATETKKEAKPKTRTLQFKAETKQLLDLMIHSLYTNKEIFLRELISNASDACDRLRFEALTNPELLDGEEELEIRLEADGENRTLTIADNGIGMSKDEVISNIGTIARSGTRELMDQLQEAQSSDAAAQLIGQFGVGFYSAFMAADKVTLLTRRAGEDGATLWQSTGDGKFKIRDAEKSSRGTIITLHLKPVDRDNGIEDFTETYTVSRIVKRYSDFVSYPIILKDEREEPVKDEDGNPVEGKTETVVEHKTVNSMKPIWTRPESEVTAEEYNEFYKHISHDWNEPLNHFSFRAEGRIEYQSLLFIPSTAPYDFYYHGYEFGLQLYVRRVMIMDQCEDLVPRYLRFVRGVVDSSDLPLNISRQRLQEDRHISQIRRWLTKKVLDSLTEMMRDDREKYDTFWEQFGRSVKEGIGSDWDNKDKITKLLLFQSSADDEKLTTLADYVERMPEEQTEIYYLTGESRAVVENSPHLEAFRDKGYEVLYFVDTVDELMTQSLTEFDDKKLKSIGKGTVDLGNEEEREEKKKALETKEEELKDLLELLQKKLDDHVKHVRLTNRLTSSPVCLVGADHDYSPQMERLLQKGDFGGPKQRRILELNPEHQILANLQDRFQKDTEDPLLDQYAQLLFGYGLLAEGSELEDPVAFNQAMVEVMGRDLAG